MRTILYRVHGTSRPVLALVDRQGGLVFNDEEDCGSKIKSIISRRRVDDNLVHDTITSCVLKRAREREREMAQYKEIKADHRGRSKNTKRYIEREGWKKGRSPLDPMMPEN